MSDELVILSLIMPVLFSIFALYKYAKLSLRVEILELKVKGQIELFDDIILEIVKDKS